jgi:polyhydroxybutyrate depolymerase
MYPQAIDNHWNDGRESKKFQEHDAKINEVSWIEKLIAELKRTYSVDKKRMYATGISNGGIFSRRLAIELGHHFAAVGSLTAQIARPLAKAKPKNPVSVVIINGTQDSFVPYDSGEVTPRLFPRLSKMMKQPSRTLPVWRKNWCYARSKFSPLVSNDTLPI